MSKAGRGPTPYNRSHSTKPASMASQAGTTGRGGRGVFGTPTSNKGGGPKYEHPQSHAAFEKLGAD